jgi:hypothetical protein
VLAETANTNTITSLKPVDKFLMSQLSRRNVTVIVCKLCVFFWNLFLYLTHLFKLATKVPQ